MALEDKTLECFRQLAKQNYPKARECAIAAMRCDGSKKNERAIRDLEHQFACMPSIMDADAMPYQIKGMLRVEDVARTFIGERYVATPKAAALSVRILRIREAQERLAAMRVPYRVAVMLEGPSGCGKTEFARMLAARLGLPLAILDFSRVIDSLMGKTARNIADAFDYATGQPCLLFLDEIDCVAVSRAATSEGATKERQSVTITLMQLLDRLPAGCLLLAATNRPDLIDPALLRRFPIRAEFEPYGSYELAHMVERLVATTDVEWDAGSVKTTADWCYAHSGGPASDAIAAAIEAMVDAVIDGHPFRMPQAAE